MKVRSSSSFMPAERRELEDGSRIQDRDQRQRMRALASEGTGSQSMAMRSRFRTKGTAS